MTEKPEFGSVVSFYYKGGPKGEDPVDSRTEGEPLRMVVGSMAIPRGLEMALLEMERGEERVVEISPDLGFGDYDEKQTTWYTKAMMDDGIGYKVAVGDLIFWTDPNTSQRRPAYVTEVLDELVHLDFNHPWAGKTLEYWVKLVDFD